MINCKLKQIHRVKHSIPIKINTQTHRYDELVYFISGNGTTKINQTIHTYSSGDFAFYKTGTPHDENDPKPCDIIWLHFSFDMAGINLNEGVFSDDDGELLSILQKIRTLSLEPNEYNHYLIECYLAEMILTVSKKQNHNTYYAERINWKKILNYIDTNINEQIDFYAIAKLNNYSYDRFRHLFTKHFGMSPYAYLTNQRISHAKRLLKNSNSNITDIAFDCGFNSSSQFTNIFKKYLGCTPKEYKKSC